MAVELVGFIPNALLALALGGLIGLEREHTTAQTVIGLRTFAIVTFFGFLLATIGFGLSPLAGALFSAVGLAGIFALAFLYFYSRFRREMHPIGLTTVVMLPFCYVIGLLVQQSYQLEAAAGAIVIALLLAEKKKVHGAIRTVTTQEIIDGLLFAIIAFVIYPLIPQTPQSIFNHLVDLQLVWKIIVVASLLSFGGHLLVKYLHSKGLLIAAFFGGAVSSLAVAYLFTKKSTKSALLKLALAASSAGSYAADIVLIALISPALFQNTYLPLSATVISLLVFTWIYRNSANSKTTAFSTPLSISFVLEFTVLFLAVSFLSEIAAQYFGQTGVFVSSLLGGFVNSSATFASIALIYANGAITSQTAVLSTLLTLLGSILVKTILVAYRSRKSISSTYPMLLSFVIGVAVYLLSNALSF